LRRAFGLSRSGGFDALSWPKRDLTALAAFQIFELIPAPNHLWLDFSPCSVAGVGGRKQ
jgi:hypothetical protein